MTVHSAKGLEFPVVFLPGMEENIFPGMASVYVPSEVEEERRLAYVAITRAKEELYIFHAESRMIFGMTNRNRVSRFVEEIPETLVEHTPAPAITARARSLCRASAARSRSGKHRKQNPLRKPADSRRSRAVKARACRYIPRRRYCPAQGVRHGSHRFRHADGERYAAGSRAFDKVGTKKLFANFARLTKV